MIYANEFSLVGDGIADNFSQLQAALNMAAKTGDNCVYIPHGNYAISDTLYVSPHTTLTCDGVLVNHCPLKYKPTIGFEIGSVCEKLSVEEQELGSSIRSPLSSLISD